MDDNILHGSGGAKDPIRLRARALTRLSSNRWRLTAQRGWTSGVGLIPEGPAGGGSGAHGG
eukprot:scaffold23281_cov120-Isochrysis_galbana.AAC.1